MKKEPVREQDLLLHNRRMLELMRFVCNNNVKGIKNETQFLTVIDNPSKAANILNIKQGKQSFTISDITKCCAHFGVDANYFFIQNHAAMFRSKVKKSAFEKLIEAVQLVGMEMGAYDDAEPTEAEKLAQSVKIIEAEEKRKKDNFEYI